MSRMTNLVAARLDGPAKSVQTRYGHHLAYEVTLKNAGTVRVLVFPDDGDRVEVYRLNPVKIEQWNITLTGNVPAEVVSDAITSALATL